MNYIRRDKKPDKRTYTGAVSSVGNGDNSSAEFTIQQLSRVTEDGIRAIIGRIGIKNNLSESKYLKPKEMKDINKNGEDSYQNGMLTRPK